MDVALLVAALVALLVVEVLGIRASQKGRVDTVSELYWWVADHVPWYVTGALHTAVLAGLLWTGLHLVWRVV